MRVHRLPIDGYFLNIAEVVAKRSTCVGKQVGAVIVKDKRILSTGYNGAPRNLVHCLDIGCVRDQRNIVSGTMLEQCRGVHAEMNAIIQSAIHGVSTENAILYCTHYPCVVCAKALINAGIREVVYKNLNIDKSASEFFNEAGIVIRKC